MSTDGNDSASIAGFRVAVQSAGSSSRPFIFLHGSASDETALVDFRGQFAEDAPSYFPRGKERSEGGYTFFLRHADRSIDVENLALRSAELADLVSTVSSRHERPPILVGYSSGAITASAILARHQQFVRGAVLLRPQSPFGDEPFPRLAGIPVLLISGKDDARRQRTDANELQDKLRAADASAELHELECGHGFDPHGRDAELTRTWLRQRGFSGES